LFSSRTLDHTHFVNFSSSAFKTGSGPNSRSSQMFISYGAHQSLGTELWETPFGEVTSGMDVANQFYSYGDMPPWGKGPVQGKIYNGPEYINENFPLIDSFEKCTVQRIQKNAGSDKEQTAPKDEQLHHEAVPSTEDHRELGMAAANAAGLGGGSLASARKRLQASTSSSLLAFSSVDGQYFLGGFIVVMYDCGNSFGTQDDAQNVVVAIVVFSAK
jgi:cyclophilin family peptidyl-prolyl cis-trans isomerase